MNHVDRRPSAVNPNDLHHSQSFRLLCQSCLVIFLKPSKYAFGDHPTLKLSMMNYSTRPSPKSVPLPTTSAARGAAIPVAVETRASAPRVAAPADATVPTATIVTSFRNLRGAVSKSPFRLAQASTYSRISSVSESTLSGSD
jgi:hypothetical protein